MTTRGPATSGTMSRCEVIWGNFTIRYLVDMEYTIVWYVDEVDIIGMARRVAADCQVTR